MNPYCLDTDHMSLLRRGGANALPLEMRLSTVPDEQIATCIIVYEERMRGWMAEIARMQTGQQAILPYDSLAVTLTIYCAMNVLPFDERAATHYDALKRQVRIGPMDLKIAAIALANDATVLTRNIRDFSRVPGLKIEDWSV